MSTRTRAAVTSVFSLVLVAAACSSSSNSAHRSGVGASTSTVARSTAGATTSTAPTTKLSTQTVPSLLPAVPATRDATGKILMIKLNVGSDLATAEQFYGRVFGAKTVMAIGPNVHVLTLPQGGPGLVLITSSAKGSSQHGAFIIQVPNLKASQTLAVANGAKVQGAFSGAPQSQAARSVDLLDPWGNQVEILQIG